MAEHNLTIKATLDTSSVQRELDQINKNIMTMDGATGTGGSRGGLNQTIVKQLQMSIDQLNRTLGKIELNAKHAAAASPASVRAMAGVPDASVVSMFGGGWNGFGEWIKANRLSKPTKMGLHFGAVQLGNLSQTLEEGGFGLGSAITGIGSSALQGASVGSLFGVKAAGYGALFGAIADAGKRLKQVFDELAVSAEKLNQSDRMVGEDILARKQTQKWRQMYETTDLDTLEDEMNTLKRRASEAFNMQENYSNSAAAALNGFQAGFWNTLGRTLKWIDDPIEESQRLTDMAKEEGTRGKGLEKQAEFVEKLFEDKLKELGDQAEKEYNERMKWLEDLKKGYQELGQLETQRKELFQSIQDSYIQQGVDILSTMGKSGKYMSQMEVASLNQNRFSPITTRMDKMDRQLEHLQKIDSKMDKIKNNMGLL